MPPDLALLSTLNGSTYPCLKLIFMVTKVFEPLKFDCIWNLYAYLHYAPDMFTKTKNNLSKTVGVVEIPYKAKKAAKITNFKSCNSVKMNSISIKTPHAQILYVHSMSAKFEKYPLKTVHKLHTLQCKQAPKMTKFKRL